MNRPQITIVRRTTGCNEPRQIYAGEKIPKNYKLSKWVDRAIQAKWRTR